MKTIFKKLATAFLLLLFTSQTTFAVTSPNYWKKVGDAVMFLNDSWTFGSSSAPISEGYFDTLEVNGVDVGTALGGVADQGGLIVTGDITALSVQNPSTAPSGSLKSPPEVGGVDNGDFKYKVTFFTDFGETAASAASATVSVIDNSVNGHIMVTIPVSTDAAVTGRKLYRQFNGTGDFKFLANISDNSSTVYEDRIDNAGLDANKIAPLVNNTGSVEAHGDFKGHNRIAVGNESTLNGPSGSRDVNFDFEARTSNFNVPNIDNYTNFFSKHIIDPDHDLAADSTATASNLFSTDYEQAETNNLGYGEVLRTDANLYGSGDIDSFVASSNQVNFFGSGTLNSGIGAYAYCYKGFESTGSINECVGLQAAVFNSSNSGGDIDVMKGIDVSSPSFFEGFGYPHGTVGTNYGLYLGDQEYSGANSWSIFSAGGKVEFSAPTGKNSSLFLSDLDVTHTMTDALGPNPHSYGMFFPLTNTSGGMSVIGVAETDSNAALALQGYSNEVFPGALSNPAMIFNVGQNDGADGVGIVNSGSPLFSFRNGTYPLLNIMADGNSDVPRLNFTSGYSLIQTMTDYLPADAWASFKTLDGADGGMQIITVSSGSVSSFDMLALEDTTGAISTPPIVFRAAKKSGTGVTDLSGTDEVFWIVNNDEYGNPLVKVQASGNIYTSGAIQTASGFSTYGSMFYVDETGAMGVQSLEANSFLYNGGYMTNSQTTLASANNINMSTTPKNIYHVTGNTQINCVTPGPQNGFVTLIFDSNPLVKHNQTCTGGNLPIRLATSLDYLASANSVVQVFIDSTSGVVREVSRTSP